MGATTAGDFRVRDWTPAKKGNFALMTEIQRAPFHIVATVLTDTQHLIGKED